MYFLLSDRGICFFSLSPQALLLPKDQNLLTFPFITLRLYDCLGTWKGILEMPIYKGKVRFA